MGLIKTEEYRKEKYLPGSEKISVVLFEGDSELSTLHKAIDSKSLQYRIIAKTNTVDSLYNAVSKHKPDIVILHIVSPEIDWLRLILEVKELRTDTKIIVYSAYLGRKFILKIMGVGTAGYVAAKENFDNLIEALNVVYKGGIYLSSEILIGPSKFPEIPASINKDISFLSDREKDVIRMIGEGFSTKEIGFDLGISSKTVATYRDRIMKKLDIYNIAGLTKFAITVGLTNL